MERLDPTSTQCIWAIFVAIPGEMSRFVQGSVCMLAQPQKIHDTVRKFPNWSPNGHLHRLRLASEQLHNICQNLWAMLNHWYSVESVRYVEFLISPWPSQPITDQCRVKVLWPLLQWAQSAHADSAPAAFPTPAGFWKLVHKYIMGLSENSVSLNP